MTLPEPKYTYYVSLDLGTKRDSEDERFKQATFDNPADAMAMYSQGVSEGRYEYIVLEALLAKDPS